MADRNAVPTSDTPAGVCPGSPNRALWRSLTTLTSENAELKVKVATLERTSASAVSSGSSKFLKMELDKERTEAKMLKEQLTTAALERAALKAQLDACQERLVGAEVDGARLGEQLAEAQSAAQRAAQQLEAKDAELQALSSALAGCKEQLAAKEAALAVAEAEAAVARAGLQDVCTKGEAAQANLRSEVARLEAAQQAHLAAIAGLEQQLAQAAAQAEAAQAAAAAAQAQVHAQQLAHLPVGAAASGPASPISLGTASDVAASPEGPGDQGAQGGVSGAATPSGQAPLGLQSGIVYNVMPLVESPRLDPAAAQEQERLTHQVLSLQDKLDTLQQAYEKLAHDYSCVTEQLAARQAEVQLARLSPESTQLKQQVAQLQTQVAHLQQELFHAQLHQVSLLEEGGGPPAREGRSLKRSFTRAASMIGQRMGLRRPKSSASLEPFSRGSSMTESVASHSATASPYGATSLGPPDASPRASPTPRGGLGPAQLELLHLRQVLQEREAAVHGLEERLAGEERRQAALQEALLQQGQELGGQLEEARAVLARKQAELEVAESAARQLLEVQGSVPAEVPMPSSGEHAKCREAVQSLFKQVWRERIARQKAEFRLEQQQQLSASQSRRSTVSGVDDAALERLQAEALAADTMAAELQKAKAHQLMLQQRLEALHLQLAKQTQALESASRVSSSGRPSPRAPRGPPSPSRDAIAQHLLLKAAQQRCHEVELRLVCAERDLEKCRRRERDLNAALAQAAEWRKGAEKQQQLDKEGWRKRWERERTAVVQISGRLHATAVAQHELLSGLEVLQALLRKRGAAEGSPAGGRAGRASSRSSDTQEALKQISALLRTASTHLQILSPQQSDCLGSPRGEHVALSYPAGTSLPAPAASAGAVTPAWQGKIHTWLAEPAEPASPRLGAREEPGSSAWQQAPAPAPAPEAQPAAASAAAAGGSAIDHVLQTILEPADEDEDEGSGQLSSSNELAAPAPARAGLGSAPLEGARSRGITPLRQDSSGRSEQLLGLPEGSARLKEDDSSAIRAGEGGVGRPTSTQDSDTIPAIPAGGNPSPALPTTATAGALASTVQHSPAGHTSTSTPRSSAAAKQGLGVQWAGQQPQAAQSPERSGSPKIKALASKISSGFRRMGVACKETATYSGAATPAGAKPTPGSANGSSRAGSPVKRTGTTPVKPRKMWL